MNKKEFLEELKNRLAGLPKDDLDNRLSFYSEMIDDRVDEGKSEEEAVNEIGSVDEVVKQIASETPLTTLVKERVKPKESFPAWAIVLLVFGFPLWFPLALTALILCLVAYLLIWVLVIVTYSVEISLIVSSVGSIIAFFTSLFTGEFSAVSLGAAIMCAGGAALFIFACIWATKGTLALSKSIFTSIKTSIMRKGNK